MKTMHKLLAILLAAALFFLPLSEIAAPAAHAEETGKWVSTWSTSLVDPSITLSGVSFQDLIPSKTTLRTEITVTTAGTKLQFVFSNQFGTSDITINAASVARTKGQHEAKIEAGTQAPITFNGNAGVTIPAGQTVTSDVVDYTTKMLEKLSISLYFENICYIQTAGLSNGRTYMNVGGMFLGRNKINDTELPNATEISIGSGTITYHTIPLLESVNSFSPDVNASCAVFIGDSTLVNDTFLYYARRIASAGSKNIGVINKAIIGNKLLSDGGGLIGKLYGKAMIDRFEHDVLDVPGVKYCFVKIGLNDVLHQFSASLGPITPKYTTDQIIAGYRTLVQRAHERGIRIYFFTKSAWKGYARSFLGQSNDLVWSQEAQDMCDKLTDWALTNKEADGVIDCKPLADPSDPMQLCPSFTPDGAHLTEIGSVALADLIPMEYVGLKSSAAKTAASIANTNPYKEKEEIISRMNAPTTTTTTAKQTAPTKNGQQSTTIPNAPVSQQPITIYVTQPTAYAYIEPDTGSSATPSSYPYIDPSTVNEPISQNGAEPNTAQPVSYSVQDVGTDVTSIGSGVPIGFILVLLLVIIIAAAVVILTMGKKEEEA